MTRPYSEDLRERAVARFEAGGRRARSRRRCASARPAYREKVLAPTLAKGDIVILDNLGSHKGKAARRAIRAAGAHLLFLPPYSPDLNPIEQLFAKLKHLIRKAEPRTVETTWRKLGDLLDLFSPAECAAYLKNAGYDHV